MGGPIGHTPFRRSRLPGVALALAASLAVLAPMAATAADNPLVAEGLGIRPDGVSSGLSGPNAGSVSALMSKAESAGSVPVIAQLAAPMQSLAELSAAAAEAQTSALRDMQQRVLARLSPAGAASGATGAGLSNVKLFDYSPLLAVTVDASRLQALLNDPEVVRVEEDVAVPPDLQDSIPLIDADLAHNAGWDGTGRVVAILDTGVNKSHTFLSGEVVSEACYSTNGSGGTSLCPGGVTSSTAVGSGVSCQNASGCDHGTHVAGIAAGRQVTYNSAPIRGVAKKAKIIAIQVFSRFTSSANCGSTPAPCVLSFTSDQIKGLERVYALRNSYTIGAANMSLGGGQFSSYCDSDSRKSIIDQLVGARIATVISSGNSGFDGSVGAPGCISSAITVGSTTKSDAVSSFSNHASMVDLMAPGSSITSSAGQGSSPNVTNCNTCFGIKSGTSMAAPHVTGAWAVMRQRDAGATVSQILSGLASTGVNVSRAGVTKPRIDLDDALATIGAIGTATLIAPDDTIIDTTPTYVWRALGNATHYRLWVANAGVSPKINVLISAASAGCASGTGTCSYTSGTALSNGASTWYIQGSNNSNVGPWSPGKSFTVNTSASPGAVSPIEPSATITDTTPTYEWTSIGAATWYRIWVNNGGATPKLLTWVSATSAGCASAANNCTYTPTTVLSPGHSTWWVRTWNPNGWGPWSFGRDFYVATTAPVATTVTGPNGTISDNTPTYTWNAVPEATWYYLWVSDSTASPRIAQWFTASQAYCSSGSGTCFGIVSTPIANGNATAYVRTYNSYGYGPWSPGHGFSVAAMPHCVFDNQFSNPDDLAEWDPKTGAWSHQSNTWYYTPGVDGKWATTLRDDSCGNLDYTARFWRSGSDTANALWARGSTTMDADGAPSSGYMFSYTRDGRYAVWKRVSGTWTSLQGYTASSAVNKNAAWNVLRATLNGSKLSFYINGTKVWTGIDTSLTYGRPGLTMFRSAGSTGNGLWIDYATGTGPAPGASLASTASTGTPLVDGQRYGSPTGVPMN